MSKGMTEQPTLKLLPKTDSKGRALFELQSPYVYELGPGSSITIPKGFVTNFGTIPRIFAWIISPAQLREAAIVHDWMCDERFVGSPLSGYSRWMADAVLYEAMARLGFRWPKRFAVFTAVRLFAIFTGQVPWSKRPKIEEIKVE